MSEPVEALLQRFQNEILEAIVGGTSLEETALLICHRVEALANGATCSLLAVRDGRLRPLAAPSLPAFYSQALDGLAIGDGVGSCGTAAFLGHAIEVRDIATDPLWAHYRDFVLPLGLRACWSSPVFATGREVVAAFALYFREPRGPSELERRLVEASVHLSAIAIEKRNTEAANYRLGYFDPLTELPNRRSFDAAIAALSADPSARFALLLIGFDRLDSFDVGIDEISSEWLLRDVAQRLQELGAGRSAFSLDGKRFAVLVEPCPDRAALDEVGHAIVRSLRQPRDWDSGPFERGISVGGALAGPDGTTPDILRQNAELARVAAKADSDQGYASFEPGLRAAALRRRSLTRDVDAALAEGRLVPYYQPVIRLRDRQIIGLEALMRMRLRDGRTAPAAEFSEAFADPRLSRAITDSLIHDVARDAAAWLAAGIDFGHVGINVAMSDFQDDRLPERLQSAFGRFGVPLRHLVVEITELISTDDPRHDVAGIVQRLRDLGALVALDDFGTGFASLTHLLHFPSDIIKIDRSFIDRMLTDGNSAVIVESLIDIARRLGKRVVAEGIETEDQAARLIALGCVLGQGYLYAAAADAATTTRRLAGAAALAFG